MNLRQLKKFSKLAAPLLPLLGDTRDQFPSEGDGHVSMHISDRKHWMRSRAKYPLDMQGEVKYRPRDGQDWIVMRSPWYAWAGTPMVGAMSGYYEPEWDEQTAWESLLDIVGTHFTDWSEDGPIWTGQHLRRPMDWLRAARDITHLTATEQKE